jgi:uncharacterized protein YraI
MLRKHLFCFTAALILLALPQHITQAQDFYGDGWNAQYFDNENLAGSPIATQPLVRLDLQFGDGSPAEGVPADNFSAVYTTNEFFSANTFYEFVIEADEGVRLTVGGATLIDQFRSGGGTFTATIQGGGTREIRVEYREGSGNAFIRVFWRISNAPPPPVFPAGALPAVVVGTTSLVVRDAPFIGAGRITSIKRGETYAVIGRDPSARWFLLQLPDRQGWAFGYYLFIDGNEFNAPVFSPFNFAGVVTSDIVVRAIDGIRLREGPNVGTPQIGRITPGDIMTVTGRSEYGSWYQVVYKDTSGWVFSPLTEFVQGEYDSVPVIRGAGRNVPPTADPDYDIGVDGE